MRGIWGVFNIFMDMLKKIKNVHNTKNVCNKVILSHNTENAKGSPFGATDNLETLEMYEKRNLLYT